MKKMICRVCECDISKPGFVCQKRLCPLDEFIPAGHIEIDDQPAPKPRKTVKRYFIPTESNQHPNAGGPAPSDTLKRYEH